MRSVGLTLLTFGTFILVWAQPTVSNVRSAQLPGTTQVIITYDLAHAQGHISDITVEVSSDGGVTYTSATGATGAVGSGIAAGTGKTVTWDAGVQWPAQLLLNARARVTATDTAVAPAGFTLIPGGTFTMGDTKNEGSPIERPTRLVTLSAFYVQFTETTYAQWKEIHDWNLSGNRGYDLAEGQRGAYTESPYGGLPDTLTNNTHPVTRVSWWDIIKWCNAKSRKEGYEPCYYANSSLTEEIKSGSFYSTIVYVKWSADGYRLPTEAEWEYAARGGLSENSYPWGNQIAPGQANYVDGQKNSTTPVGYYNGSQTPSGGDMKNGYGLYDVSGNVWELVWDRFGIYSLNAQVNPHGPDSGDYVVVRGGSIGSSPDSLRCANRNNFSPIDRQPNVGFRLARNAAPGS